MTEFIRIQVTDLADLINSMEDWRRAHDRVVEQAQKADVAWNRDIADVRMELSSFRRMVQEALGSDEPALISPDELERRIRDLRMARQTPDGLRQGTCTEPVDAIESRAWELGDVIEHTRDDDSVLTVRLNTRRPSEDPAAGGKYWHGKVLGGPLNDPMIGEDIGLLEGHPTNRRLAVSADGLATVALDQAPKRIDVPGLGHPPMTYTIPAGLLFERPVGTAHTGELHVVGPIRDVDGDGPPTQSMPAVARQFLPGDPCPGDDVQVVGWIDDGQQVWARDRTAFGVADTWSFHDGDRWTRDGVSWDDLLAESGGVVDCTAENDLATVDTPAEGP